MELLDLIKEKYIKKIGVKVIRYNNEIIYKLNCEYILRKF